MYLEVGLLVEPPLDLGQLALIGSDQVLIGQAGSIGAATLDETTLAAFNQANGLMALRVDSAYAAFARSQISSWRFST